MIKTPFATVIILVGLSSIQPAHAYMDPGTGSMILQIILGGVAGMMIAGKLFWHRLLILFRIRKENPDSVTKTESDNNDTP